MFGFTCSALGALSFSFCASPQPAKQNLFVFRQHFGLYRHSFFVFLIVFEGFTRGYVFGFVVCYYCHLKAPVMRKVYRLTDGSCLIYAEN